MKVCTIVFGVLLAAVASLAVEHGPLYTALQPQPGKEVVFTSPEHDRPKRHLLLGAAGAGLLGAGVVGAGLVGAGLLGAGVVGAKAGLLGGALAAGAYGHGRSYGGYYGGYHSYGGYGGYGGYRSYYPSSSYIVHSW